MTARLQAEDPAPSRDDGIGQGKERYRVKLDFFEGPLDLLLYLIRKNEMDICAVSLSQIAEQYLEYLNKMERLNLEVAGEFILVAATLIHWKSKALLPAEAKSLDDQDDDVESPVDLVKRLLEYKKYKEAAQEFRGMQELQRTVFVREVIDPILEELRDAEPMRLPLNMNPFLLVRTLQKIVQRERAKRVHEIKQQAVPLGVRIRQIFEHLRSKAELLFDELFFGAKSRNSVIVSFLALLEMARLSLLRIYQPSPFGSIRIQSRIGNDMDDDKARTQVEKLVASEEEMGYAGHAPGAQMADEDDDTGSGKVGNA